MNFIKKFFLKRKLKKAIKEFENNYRGEDSFIYIFGKVGLDEFSLPGFTYPAFKEFIETRHPELVPNLCGWGNGTSIAEYYNYWMKPLNNYSVRIAKIDFLKYIMKNL